MKRFLNKYLPSHNEVKSHKTLKVFGSRLNDPSLWTIHRRSIPKAAAIGIFCAYIPLPIEMLLAAVLAWQFRAYMPLAITLVWISNPLTWFILYTPPYWLGSLLLDIERVSLKELNLSELGDQFYALMLGCLIFGTFLSSAAYILSRVIWRMIAVNRIEKRRMRLEELRLLQEEIKNTHRDDEHDKSSAYTED